MQNPSAFNHIQADLPDTLGSHNLPLVFAQVTLAKTGVTLASLSALCFQCLAFKET